MDEGKIDIEKASVYLAAAMGLDGKASVFPWQRALLEQFLRGEVPRALDIPTGLGKTAVMAVWLVARAHGAPVPRRLVYVVDRRAVVDQATDTAMALRRYIGETPELARGLGLRSGRLPVSTLRGQLVDNREWLSDPAAPAIIVGTVDMIGSRLLFAGYGVSRRMRPYHAGLLGTDTLIVLDESHLVPPFEKLLATISDDRRLHAGGTVPHTCRPPFLLSLSATGAFCDTPSVFRLTPQDVAEGTVTHARLYAEKRLRLMLQDDKTPLPETICDVAFELARTKRDEAPRIILFCNSRRDAKAVRDMLEKRARKNKRDGEYPDAVETELFTGGRRVFERTKAADRLRELGFIGGGQARPDKPAFVIATSAGEVGVDMDADHMCSDLVPWERMVQRLGRVNRRGGRVSDIIVIEQAGMKKDAEGMTAAAAETAELIKMLPKTDDGAYLASPGAIIGLTRRAERDGVLQSMMRKAVTPPPLRPELTRQLAEAWSLTSLKTHTGRPPVDPWLRGWHDEKPQTSLVWRCFMPLRTSGDETAPDEIDAFFRAAPIHTSERLEITTPEAVEWLVKRAQRLFDKEKAAAAGDVPIEGRVLALVLDQADEFQAFLKMEDMPLKRDDPKIRRKKKDALKRLLPGVTLVLDARIAGLSSGGLLDAGTDKPPVTADSDEPWLTLENGAPVVGFRIREQHAADESALSDPLWRSRYRFVVSEDEEGNPESWIVVEAWIGVSDTEEDEPCAAYFQHLDTHHFETETCARHLVERLGLSPEYGDMLAAAARCHDLGKAARRWQRAFNAPADGIYAKTKGPVATGYLDGYRHEFGSVIEIEKEDLFGNLTPELRDLAIHLVAAHHGHARPVIRISGCDGAPPSVLTAAVEAVAQRFARLQKRWGPWGLAWWESLLRAADREASGNINKTNSPAKKEVE